MAEFKMPKYVFKGIHIDEYSKVERCVVCGKVISEGRQVCPNCEKKGANKK